MDFRVKDSGAWHVIPPAQGVNCKYKDQTRKIALKGCKKGERKTRWPVVFAD